MANYFAQARTNYFKVKDPEAFIAHMNHYNVTVIARTLESGESLYGFIDDNADGAGLDWSSWDERTDEETDIPWVPILASHLAEGHVAIVMEVGWEAYRWLNGYAFAVNHLGEAVEVNLMDIYERAKTLGPHIREVGD